MPENQQLNLNFEGVHCLPTRHTNKQTRKESQEAASYQSNIGLNLDPNAQQHQGENLTILNDIDLGECKTILKDCEALLLDPIVRPEVQPHVYDQQSYFYIFLIWDTETTTIGKSAEIVQISVVSKDEQFCFSEYVTPKTAISSAASLVHGLTTQVSNGVNVLYKDGKEVQSIPLQECLTRLLNFIETTRDHYNRETHKPVITVMVGHNSALFDTPVLFRSAGSSFVDQLTSLDVIFADSLLLFKSIRKSELPSSTILLPCKGNKLISLYSHLFKEVSTHTTLSMMSKPSSKFCSNFRLKLQPNKLLSMVDWRPPNKPTMTWYFSMKGTPELKRIGECVIRMDEALFQMPLSKSSLSRESFTKLSDKYTANLGKLDYLPLSLYR
jgi:hypothetical protein